MKPFWVYAGLAGLILMASGAGMLSFAPEHQVWSYVLMAAGGVLTVAAVALNLEDLGNILRGRTVRYGTNAVFYSLVVLFIVGAANFIASRHHKRFDVSEQGIHTLAPQTVKILKFLEKDVELLAFFTEANEQRRRFEDLTEEYRYQTDHLKIRLVDPRKAPGEARRYEIAQDGTIVILADTREARITTLSEEDLTNAIVKATRKSKKVVCFVTGHGEASTTDGKEQGYTAVADALRKENYELKDVLLLQAPEVPSECSALVVAGPRNALLPAEADSISKYLASGGRVLVLKRDPRSDTGLDDLLARYGLKVDRDIVVDRLSRAIGGDEFVPVVTSYEDHPVTKELRESGVVSFFPVASSVETITGSESGVASRVIARTGESAWGETGETVVFEPGKDHAGPVGLVGAASGNAAPAPAGESVPAPADPNGAAAAPAKERRLLLFGDSDFASNGYVNLSANADFFLNSVAWLTEESDLISIRSKEKKPQPVTITARGQFLLLGLTFVTPLATAAAGGIIWYRRRKL